jgi:hypothetical protein
LVKKSGPDNKPLKIALRATEMQKLVTSLHGAEVKQPVWKGDFI